MRAFVRLRQVLVDHKELSDLFNKLETRVDQHDAVINEIVEAIRELMEPPKTEAIGFHLGKREGGEG
jgi:NADPH-dependent 7-cyano-7-deazaguanine reductase QueF